jgi:hypothetical protein
MRTIDFAKLVREELLTESGFPVGQGCAVTELRTENKGDVTMKFMMIVKSSEKSGYPPKALMDEIDKLGKEAGDKMIGGGGLGPTALGARVRLSGGKVTVIDGPFAEAKEIIGGYAQFELKSKEEAVDSAVRFMELHKKYWPGWEGETEVRQMFSPEDFTHCKP